MLRTTRASLVYLFQPQVSEQHHAWLSLFESSQPARSCSVLVEFDMLRVACAIFQGDFYGCVMRQVSFEHDNALAWFTLQQMANKPVRKTMGCFIVVGWKPEKLHIIRLAALVVLLVGARDPPWITLPIHGELFHDGPVGAGSTSAEAYGAGAYGAGVHLFGNRELNNQELRNRQLSNYMRSDTICVWLFAVMIFHAHIHTSKPTSQVKCVRNPVSIVDSQAHTEDPQIPKWQKLVTQEDPGAPGTKVAC